MDFRGLNQWVKVKRPAYPVNTPHEAVHSFMPGSRWFSVMYAKNGYHQILLDKESQDYTCFMTPYGRFKFLRAPVGFISTGDKYNYEGDRAIAGVPDTTKVVDDILTANPTFPDHLKRVITVLQQCRSNGITLSPKKFMFSEPEVHYVGYIVGRDGIKADPAKLKAIREFPKPKNISELISFDGMINQLGNFSTELTAARGPLRDLRMQRNVFNWGEAHDKVFEAVKECLLRLPVLALFNPKLPTRIDTDGSKMNGLGCIACSKSMANCARVNAQKSYGNMFRTARGT